MRCAKNRSNGQPCQAQAITGTDACRVHAGRPLDEQKAKGAVVDAGRDDKCPRCSGDHSWCQSVRDDEYGPSTGQDTERLRDEIAQVVYDRDTFAGDLHWSRTHPQERDRCLGIADRLLDGPLRQLITERDQARAQVQRVRELDPIEVALGGLAYVLSALDAT